MTVYQVFQSNTNNSHTVICFQVFLSNTDYYPVSSYYFFLIIIICLHVVKWFQVMNDFIPLEQSWERKNCTKGIQD